MLIYRTESYQKLKSSIDRTSKKLEKKKETVTNISKQKSKDKKIARYDGLLKDSNRDMSLVKMKSIFAVGFTLVVLFGVLNSAYDGKVVAKLPFEPFPLVRNLSHRGLIGIDYTDCSMIFLYALCSLTIRTNIQKFFGWAPPKGSGGLFGNPYSSGLFPVFPLSLLSLLQPLLFFLLGVLHLHFLSLQHHGYYPL